MPGSELGLGYKDARSFLEGCRVLSLNTGLRKAVSHPEGPEKEVGTSATLSGETALPSNFLLQVTFLDPLPGTSMNRE